MIWQPIETAPKDGTLVIIWGSMVAVSPARWVTDHKPSIGGVNYIGPAKDYADWQKRKGSDGWRVEGSEWLHAPTHWMPLPPAPTAGQE